MLNFNYYNKTRIIFGKDTHKEVGKHLKGNVKRYFYTLEVKV